MSINKPASENRAKSRALERYESSRRALTHLLDQKLNTDTRLATRELDRIVHRRQIVEQTSYILVPLSRFVEREIQQRVDRGEIEEGLIEAEDVLMAVLIHAQEEIPDDMAVPGTYPWLRRVSQQYINDAVKSEVERADREQSLESTVRRAGPDWPDRVLLLREVLADPEAVLPDRVLEQRITWSILDHATDYLPERWREVFLLRSVDGWDDDEIALAEGIDVQDVELINVASRAYIRECLRDSEFFQDEYE
jgi:DNA-directed RNA polymerase specialized sigma24 family protein